MESTVVNIVPFDEVTPEFAAAEGEGDLTLAFWRRVHWAYFSGVCEGLGREADERMPVVCEHFEIRYVFASKDSIS